MAKQWDFDDMFNSEAFIKNYKIGEKITGKFAQSLIEQSAVIADSKSNLDRPLVVLDNACGAGVISSILHNELDDQIKRNWKLTCADLSEGMLEYTRHRMEREGWLNAELKKVDAQETNLPSDYYTHVFTAFGKLWGAFADIS